MVSLRYIGRNTGYTLFHRNWFVPSCVILSPLSCYSETTVVLKSILKLICRALLLSDTFAIIILTVISILRTFSDEKVRSACAYGTILLNITYVLSNLYMSLWSFWSSVKGMETLPVYTIRNCKSRHASFTSYDHIDAYLFSLYKFQPWIAGIQLVDLITVSWDMDWSQPMLYILQ